MAAREEVNRPDGFADLRDAISSAQASGDVTLLGELQQQYRAEVRTYRESHPGRSPRAARQPFTRIRPVARVASDGRHVVRDADSRGVVARDNPYYDPSRVVKGWVVAFNQVDDRGRVNGRQARSMTLPDAVDDWLASVDPGDVLCLVDHQGKEVGDWVRFRRIFDSGVVGEFQIDSGPFGDRLLRELDENPAWGLSFDGRAMDWTGTDPLTITQLRITEAGPTPTPADNTCFVTAIAGREPKWWSGMDAAARAEIIRNLRPVPRIAHIENSYSRWGSGFGR